MADNELPEYLSDDEDKKVQDNQNGQYQGNFADGNQPGHTTVHATSFKDFLLQPLILKGIQEAGFEHPSAVQQECIQTALIGSDLLCQAKSGMGKTAVFVLSILQNLSAESKVGSESKAAESKVGSALILCHTRELAYQIDKEFIRLGQFLPEVKSSVFIGGESIEDQKRVLKRDLPQVIVGTPGRVLELVQKKLLNLDNLKFFVIDECDKVLETLSMRRQVQDIFDRTPHNKQVMMFSATMSQDIRRVCRRFMQNQIEVFIDSEEKLTLDGLQQYYLPIKEDFKNKKLFDLLYELQFNQVIIFVKSVQRAIFLTKLLNAQGYPSITIHSGMEQSERIKRYQEFKDFKERIMVSTDVLGRGIDISRINIVFNYDMPCENPKQSQQANISAIEGLTDSYLHRVGRAGRFGTKGLAISFISSEEDKKVLEQIQNRFAVSIKELPDEIDTSSYMNN